MSDSDMQDLDAAEGAEAERLFLSQMIEHHTGAIEMAQTEIDDGQNPDAIEMAGRHRRHAGGRDLPYAHAPRLLTSPPPSLSAARTVAP